MQRNRIKASIMVAIMVSSITLSNPIAVRATTKQDYQQKIDSNNSKKEQLEKQKSDISVQKESENKKLSEIKDKLDSKSAELEDSQKMIDGFQTNIDSIQGELNEIEDHITKLNNKITKNEEDIKSKEKEIEEKEKLLGERIRVMYKSNYMDNFIVLMIKSKSLSDLIAKAANFAYFVNNDKKLINEVTSLRKDLVNKREDLNKSKKNLHSQKQEVENKKQQLEDTKSKYEAQKSKTQSEYDEVQSLEQQKASLIRSLSNKEKELNDKIGDLSSYNDQLQKQMDSIFSSVNTNNRVEKPESNAPQTPQQPSSSSGYMRPVSGGYISCPYGPRTHPVTGKKGYHTGVDIAVPQGTPIYASHDGVVGTAQWNSAYGNMVILNYGNGIQALYGHCSRYIVSTGQSVKKGQVIAYVGSTGLSTGPHLHYEIRKNGGHVNPSPYM